MFAYVALEAARIAGRKEQDGMLGASIGVCESPAVVE